MKVLITLSCFLIFSHTVLAFNKNIDSLKTVLAKTEKPIERFTLINEILINADGFQATRPDSAYCVELFQIAQELKNDSLLATSYNWIGYYFYYTKGDNITALEYYFKALPLAEKSNDKRRISSIYFDISGIYFFLQNFEEAFRVVRKGGENLPDRSSPMHDYMLVQYQRGMSNYYLKTEQPDSALHYIHALAETNKRLKSILYVFTEMYSYGSAYSKLGEKEIAEIYFKKAKDISDSIESIGFKIRFYEYYIPFLLENKEFDKAKEQTDKLMQLGELDNNLNLKLRAAISKRKLFHALQQIDSAYFYSQMEADINALIFNQNNLNKIQALAFNENIRLMEENANQLAMEEQRKQNIQYALLGFGIISFLILFLLLSRSFITNTKLIEFFGVIALLIIFEFLNLLLHPFLERITHHSPVLMLLALVCIAALLVPMHHRMEKWATKKLVEKNKLIRLANAKKTIAKLNSNSESE